jgi:hypothetical protein
LALPIDSNAFLPVRPKKKVGSRLFKGVLLFSFHLDHTLEKPVSKPGHEEGKVISGAIDC